MDNSEEAQDELFQRTEMEQKVHEDFAQYRVMFPRFIQLHAKISAAEEAQNAYSANNKWYGLDGYEGPRVPVPEYIEYKKLTEFLNYMVHQYHIKIRYSSEAE